MVDQLLGYDFEILYQPGLLNKAADALSRVDTRVELNALTTSGIVDMNTVSEVENDEELQRIIEKLKKEPEDGGKFEWNGRLLYKGRLVLSHTSSLIPRLLHTFHDSVLGGHPGFL
ncbi:transposon Tf2-1 polyprotein isoform X1 [Cucumis melo var. makuwa]|uniref:Transposon Tf2-1 polyprotein isoform X1 n=1 Tax=Cucumis melo var. makuwa TaxID=1194695 RepID=A0A5A7VMX7_CUCMM|nr:transposon Tf2-1 polyprotein isoform X1 [Cucumis melo var. makuwa]TYJ97453.1 transposon Tf2-1 polyprotein isoform X1 [Cucumis melo var. makuwa]